jgi:hypothetical protein
VFQLHFTNSTGMFRRAFITDTHNSWSDGEITTANISRVFTVCKTRDRTLTAGSDRAVMRAGSMTGTTRPGPFSYWPIVEPVAREQQGDGEDGGQTVHVPMAGVVVLLVLKGRSEGTETPSGAEGDVFLVIWCVMGLLRPGAK